MIEEADEYDNEQHRHQSDDQPVRPEQAGANDRQFAEEQAERRRAGNGDGSREPKAAQNRKCLNDEANFRNALCA